MFSPLARRRISLFTANKRGFWSLWIFAVLFGLSLFAEFIANDRPILVNYRGDYYAPVFRFYPETAFGGAIATRASVEPKSPLAPAPIPRHP